LLRSGFLAINPQIAASSPGRGAKIQKPADESLRAFPFLSDLMIQTKAVGGIDRLSLNLISVDEISGAGCIRNQLSGEPPTTFDTPTAISAVNPRFS
jgi:hypothetical protein